MKLFLEREIKFSDPELGILNMSRTAQGCEGIARDARVFSFISFLALKVRPGVTARGNKVDRVIASKATCWIRWRRVLRGFA